MDRMNFRAVFFPPLLRETGYEVMDWIEVIHDKAGYSGTLL
jgi:hypothetical protein